MDLVVEVGEGALQAVIDRESFGVVDQRQSRSEGSGVEPGKEQSGAPAEVSQLMAV
ncbi:MAG: hypothetical protein ACT4O5_01035 [Gammaproteobacteria bacterium]